LDHCGSGAEAAARAAEGGAGGGGDRAATMCSGTANVVSHVYMLVWLVVFAVPTLL